MVEKDIENFELMKWSHHLALTIYKITRSFPPEERYGLIDQMRRASVSIPSNIMEGKARNSTKEYIRFLSIARGSLEEVSYQLLLSKDLLYLTVSEYNKVATIIETTGRLLNGVIRSLKRTI